jgi:hypothetical protein
MPSPHFLTSPHMLGLEQKSNGMWSSGENSATAFYNCLQKETNLIACENATISPENF